MTHRQGGSDRRWFTKILMFCVNLVTISSWKGQLSADFMKGNALRMIKWNKTFLCEIFWLKKTRWFCLDGALHLEPGGVVAGWQLRTLRAGPVVRRRHGGDFPSLGEVQRNLQKNLRKICIQICIDLFVNLYLFPIYISYGNSYLYMLSWWYGLGDRKSTKGARLRCLRLAWYGILGDGAESWMGGGTECSNDLTWKIVTDHESLEWTWKTENRPCYEFPSTFFAWTS